VTGDVRTKHQRVRNLERHGVKQEVKPDGTTSDLWDAAFQKSVQNVRDKPEKVKKVEEDTYLPTAIKRFDDIDNKLVKRQYLIAAVPKLEVLLAEVTAKRDELKEAIKALQQPAEKTSSSEKDARKIFLEQRLVAYAGVVKRITLALEEIKNATEDLFSSVMILCQTLKGQIKKATSGTSTTTSAKSTSQPATPDPTAVNPRLVNELARYAELPDLPPKYSKAITESLLAARNILGARYQAAVGAIDPNKQQTQHAEILLELGACVGPNDRGLNEKGQSDSFFLKGPDGKLAYVMKPIQGESITSADWERGGGPVREILASELNDLIATSTGLDCRCLKTVPVALQDPSFETGGARSNDSRRVGSLQVAAPPGSKPARELLADPPRTPAEFKTFNDQFDEDECHAIAVRHFLTLDQDTHAGNFMVADQGVVPGKKRLIPIDAGQTLPSPAAAKRNRFAVRLKAPKTTLSDSDPFLPQLPLAHKELSPNTQAAIQKLDPKKMAEDLRAKYASLEKAHPEMAGKVEPGSFDLLRRSAKFLKLGVQSKLTLYEISVVYGEGFDEVVDAPDEATEDKKIQEALVTATTLKKCLHPDGLKGLLVALHKLGFKLNSGVENLRLDQKLLIIQNQLDPTQWAQAHETELKTRELVDLSKYLDSTAPQNQPILQLVQQGFQGVQYKDLQEWADFKFRGGDPQLQKMLARAGKSQAYAAEVNKPIKDKLDILGQPLDKI
jgi:hypothetical protein